MEQRTRIIGYVRCSTDLQSKDGASLAVQRAKLDAFVFVHDLELIDTIEDAGWSAKTLERPGLQRALAILDQGGADGLLVLKLDRLTRSVSDLGTLIDQHFGEKPGKALLAVQDSIDTRTAAGRLVLNVLVSVAQWEREAIGERTSMALRHLQAQGRQLGAPGLGYAMVDGEVRPIDSELETIGHIRDLRNAGHTLEQIARILTDERRPTKRGGRWGPATVANVLRRLEAERASE